MAKVANSDPIPLKLWERFKRLEAVSGEPNSVLYGLAAVSKKVRPQPMTKRHATKAKKPPLSAGTKAKAPKPNNNSPNTTPRR